MPGPVKVKVVALMVAGFIPSLNVAVTTVEGHTPTARSTGISELTVGATHGVLLVVKVHTKLVASALPYSSMAPVVIVAVYRVFSARALDGVKVAVSVGAS